jgi:hypothetical protein
MLGTPLEKDGSLWKEEDLNKFGIQYSRGPYNVGGILALIKPHIRDDTAVGETKSQALSDLDKEIEILHRGFHDILTLNLDCLDLLELLSSRTRIKARPMKAMPRACRGKLSASASASHVRPSACRDLGTDNNGLDSESHVKDSQVEEEEDRQTASSSHADEPSTCCGDGDILSSITNVLYHLQCMYSVFSRNIQNNFSW